MKGTLTILRQATPAIQLTYVTGTLRITAKFWLTFTMSSCITTTTDAVFSEAPTNGRLKISTSNFLPFSAKSGKNLSQVLCILRDFYRMIFNFLTGLGHLQRFRCAVPHGMHMTKAFRKMSKGLLRMFVFLFGPCF